MRSELEVKIQAERAATFQPRRVCGQDLLTVQKAYETLENNTLTDQAAPSQRFVARKVNEIETVFKAELLTMVTGFTTLAPAMGPVLGAFKITEKKLGICMPWDSESLRQRFKTMGICFCYLRSAYPRISLGHRSPLG